MTIAAGNMVYKHGSPPCAGAGLQWNREDLDTALAGDVAAILFDDEGRAKITSIFADVPETSFAQEGLNYTLKPQEKIDDWRVGEAIAESCLPPVLLLPVARRPRQTKGGLKPSRSRSWYCHGQ